MKEELRTFLDKEWITLIMYKTVSDYLDKGIITQGMEVDKKEGYTYFSFKEEGHRTAILRLKNE